LIIDPSVAYPEALAHVEDVLYGSEDGDARLPDIGDLLDLFEQHAILTVIDHGDGSYTIIGPDDVVQPIDATSYSISWPSVVQIDEDTYRVSSL
jgi:hypothetical protein